MFKNIGPRIKILANILCFVGIVAYVVLAILIFVFEGSTSGVMVGICCLIFGPLISWVGSFTMYGFGELIEKATAIEKNTRSYNNERLLKLEKLKEEGILTEEEYKKIAD